VPPTGGIHRAVHVGVQVSETFELKQIDEEAFEE
jgi:hypothetical protein